MLVGSTPAQLLLKKQLSELKKSGTEGFSAGLVDDDNLQKWQVMIMGPPETLYEGGYFKAQLDFPDDYPNKPPKMSILHDPGEDRWGYETPDERWLPVHTVETIIMSVISMLAEPNPDSPANVDAAKEFRDNYTSFKKKLMVTDQELSIFANLMGVTLFLLVVAYHYIAVNSAKSDKERKNA